MNYVRVYDSGFGGSFPITTNDENYDFELNSDGAVSVEIPTIAGDTRFQLKVSNCNRTD